MNDNDEITDGLVFAALDDREDGLRLAELDWFDVMGKGDRLHHATFTPEQYEELALWGQVHTEDEPPITLTCGRKTSSVYIPGVFTRMTVQRCSHCCDRLGYPRGKGSPKNDDALRSQVLAKLGQPT